MLLVVRRPEINETSPHTLRYTDSHENRWFRPHRTPSSLHGVVQFHGLEGVTAAIDHAHQQQRGGLHLINRVEQEFEDENKHVGDGQTGRR